VREPSEPHQGVRPDRAGEPEPVKLRAHGVLWTAAPQFAAAVPKLDMERIRQPERLGPEALVKDGRRRSVLRLPDPDMPEGRGIYVKRYKFPALRRRILHALWPTQPIREWQRALALRRAGIPTPEPLAAGVRTRCGMPVEGFFISREVPDAETLRECIHCRPELRAELLEELVGLTARLLEAGFSHSDYHVANLLVQPAAPPGQRIQILDLHSARRARTGWRSLAQTVGRLMRSMLHHGVSRRERLAFSRGLLERLGVRSEAALARRSAALEALAGRLYRRRMRGRMRECLRQGPEVCRERAAGFLVHRARGFQLRDALEAVTAHRAALDGGGAGPKVLRRGTRTEVTLCPLAGGRTVCVKAFRRDGAFERLKDLFRPRSRARQAWVAAWGLQVRRLPAARPLALLESRPVMAGRPDYLVTEALESDGNLFEFLTRRTPDAALRRRLGAAIAGLLRRLDDTGVRHPDMKPTNVLAKKSGVDLRLWLVDLDRARFDRRMSRRHWVKCLAQLNAGLPAAVTVLDRLRCLRELARGRWGAAERLGIARAVYRTSLRRRPAWLR